MQELSLNILDIVQNSVKAGATLIEIAIEKDTLQKSFVIHINDNGCGMSEETVKRVIDPFYTTRTTRKVGLGVPFFKMSAEMTGGSFIIDSTVSVGTKVTATYCYEHIDMMPLGDIASTVLSLVSVNPDIDFIYRYQQDDESFTMDTREIKVILEGLPINSNEVLIFIKDFINENQSFIQQ